MNCPLLPRLTWSILQRESHRLTLVRITVQAGPPTELSSFATLCTSWLLSNPRRENKRTTKQSYSSNSYLRQFNRLSPSGSLQARQGFPMHLGAQLPEP